MYHVHLEAKTPGGLRKMGVEGDMRVAAAKRWLQRRLEEAFSETSFYCRSVFAEFQYPPVTTGEGDPVVRQAVRQFRDRSLECVRDGFSRFLEVIRTSQHDIGDDLADLAKNLTWQAIDETFWPASDRGNPSRFQEWTTQAEAGFWVEGGVPMVSPECNVPSSSLAGQLNCDFRTQFEHLLNMLRDEALSNPTAIPSNTPVEEIPEEQPVDGIGPAHKLQEQVAASNTLRFNGNLWAVSFGGGSASTINDFVGVQYISLILKQKLSERPDLRPSELVNMRYGREATSELELRDEVLPERHARAIKNRLQEIEVDLEGRGNKDIDELIDQKDQLQKYLANGRAKLPGADRSYRQAVFPGEAKRALDAVRKAIKVATEKMAEDKALVGLAAHLDANIKFGTTVSYIGSLAWAVEPGVFPRKKS
jgi:hypothetical protein